MRARAWQAAWTLGLAAALAGVSCPARGQPPSTPEAAARAIDLRSWPLLAGAEDPGQRSLARLTYRVQGQVKPAYESQKKGLAAKGWKESPGGYITDEYASGTFVKDGFTLALSVTPAGEPGLLMVSLSNLGNVDVAKLPVPAGARSLFQGPTTAMYVTEAAVPAAKQAVATLLQAKGWVPYGTAGDSLIFKQNAVRLNAMVSAAPAQGGKTVVQYSAEQLSADLPAPPGAEELQYSDGPTQLFFDFPGTREDVAAFYTKALAPAGWKATTAAPVESGFEHFLIFRNPAKDLLDFKLTTVEGKTRVLLRYQTAAEVAATERALDEEAARKKAAMKPAARPTVAVKLPAEAREVKASAKAIAFTVAPGQARAAVEAIRQQLRAAGWKEGVAALEAVAGSVALSKGDGSVTITYTDTGVLPPEVEVSAIGVELERAGGTKP